MRHHLLVILVAALFASVSPGLSVGDKVPDFQLSGTDGKEYGLKTALAASAAVVVVFVATKCPYSNAYNERYNLLVDELRKRPKKIAFLAVNSNANEPLDEVKKHAADRGFRFAVLKDEAQKVADLFRAEKTPEVFLIGAKGDVLYHGRIDDDTEGKNIQRRDLLAAVDEYLAGKPVTVKETKAFGCSIKRK